MAKKNPTSEILCILDRSGSMSRLVDDTIGGFNAFIAEQQKLPGKARVSLVLFDDQYEVLWDRLDLAEAPEIDGGVYWPRGSTALNDAVGKGVSGLMAEIKGQAKKKRPDHVVVLIITDGQENASREFTGQAVRELVAKVEDKGWSFIFIGAGVDAFAMAGSLGMSKGAALSVSNDSHGNASGYAAANRGVTRGRTSGSVGNTADALSEEDAIY